MPAKMHGLKFWRVPEIRGLIAILTLSLITVVVLVHCMSPKRNEVNKMRKKHSDKRWLRGAVSVITFIIAFTLAWGAPACVFVATRNTLLCLGLFAVGIVAAIPFAKIAAWCDDYDNQ
jgi:hypothetical protein